MTNQLITHRLLIDVIDHRLVMSGFVTSDISLVASEIVQQISKTKILIARSGKP